MGSIVSRIVLTGGPCAGKTRSLTKIEEHFEELGYKVIIVPETATILINGGIRCFGNKALDDFESNIPNAFDFAAECFPFVSAVDNP